MLDVAPFRGVRYASRVVGDLSLVTCPPYDVIAPEARSALERASPYNMVRLVLGRDEPNDNAGANKYTRARELLDRWLAEGTVERDGDASLYVYEQEYSLGAQRRIQRGVLAAVALEDAESGSIVPHERTMPKPVEDRLSLLRATRANLEPVFAVVGGRGEEFAAQLKACARSEPASAFASSDDDVEHRLWVVSEPPTVDGIRRAVHDATAIIADGHHRYRTALLYRDERRSRDGEGPWDRILLYLVDATSDGPAILPIHRVVSGIPADQAIESLKGAFDIEPAPRDDLERVAAMLRPGRQGERRYAMIDREHAWLLRLADARAEREALPESRSQPWRDLDVATLHALVFERLLPDAKVSFVHSPSEAAEALDSGDASIAFLLAPVPFESVRAVALAGEAMPPKSTYFFPKPRDGVVIRQLDD
jgi:uncharacterized protein (DUF1015 family)